MKQLERGKLYQVKNWEGWVIAEYTCACPAHTATGFRSSDGAKSWAVPDRHGWRGIRGGSFHLNDRGMQVRPVPQETIDEIARLRGEIERLGKEQQAVIRELVSLCN